MSDLTTLREAYRAKLTADSTLQGLLGAIAGISPAQYPVFYRRIRREMLVPSIMLSDTGTLPDPTVPLQDRMIRADVFHTDFEKAEAILARVQTLLDDGKRMKAGIAPLTAAGWRIMTITYSGDGEEEVEEGDVIQRVGLFRLLAYDTT